MCKAYANQQEHLCQLISRKLALSQAHELTVFAPSEATPTGRGKRIDGTVQRLSTSNLAVERPESGLVL